MSLLDLEEPTGTPTLYLAGPVATARHVIFKVKAFDPTKHPRGYKGLFLDTPDKKDAGTTKQGDVIATKSGKVFKVEGHGAKGIKVNSVDPDTGEVLSRGTIVANGIEVAVVESGKGIGTRHKIGDLPEGTYVQHPKSGKRFIVSKHGNWTTVYPVDNQGATSGKHTVLPPVTEVIVASKSTSGQVTPASAQAVRSAVAGTTPTAPVSPRPSVPTPSAPKDQSKELKVDVGDFMTHADSPGETFEVTKVGFDGRVYVTDPAVGEFWIGRDTAKWTKQIQEVMPQNLKRPPRPYASGVAEDSEIVIDERVRGGYGNSYYGQYKWSPEYTIKRVSGAGTEVLGNADTVSAARKIARDRGEAHEGIHERRAGVFLSDHKNDLKVGDWIASSGTFLKVQEIHDPPSWDPDKVRLVTSGSPYARTFDPAKVVYIGDSSQYSSHKDAQDSFGGYGNPGEAWLEYWRDEGKLTPTILDHAAELYRKQNMMRAARPNLYLPQLQSDWMTAELVGKSKGDALAALRKLGYAEITPREPNLTKYVNARGNRLHIRNKGGIVTAVDEIQTQSTAGGGAGFHSQLQKVLDSGGDLGPLNPAESASNEERTSHTRQILWDMAKGKQNGVERLFQSTGGTIKVKSDLAYHKEIEADPSWDKQRKLVDAANQVQEPGVNVPVRQDVMQNHWGVQSAGTYHIPDLGTHGDTQGAVHLATAAIALGERNGVAAEAKKTWPGLTYEDSVQNMATVWRDYQRGDTAAFTSLGWSQGTSDYLVNTLQDVATRGERQADLRNTERTRRVESIYIQQLSTETATRRKAEGTVASAPGGASTFELPLWDDVKMEAQDIGEVESLAQNSPTNTAMVPFFMKGGVLKDGVAYARRDRTGTTVVEATVAHEFDDTALQRLGGTITRNSRFPNPQGSNFNRVEAGVMALLDEGGGRKIEYVPHDKHGQSAPTNQRGRLTFYGYTPEEAADKMESLGLTHGLEEEVPFTSIMRSERRYGLVHPLSSAYVSGEAPLPKIPAAISHGMSSYNFDIVMDSGGLLPIAERFRVGLPITGTIPLNDIRAGVDNMVFAAMHDQNHQSYGDISVILKDSAFLRRDIMFCDRNFNTGANRYPYYRQYHNRFRREAGIRDADKNAYAEIEPAARQAHIDSIRRNNSYGLSAQNNEYNMGGGLAIEDMAVIVATSQSQADQFNRKFDQLLAAGRISERPTVQVGGLAQATKR